MQSASSILITPFDKSTLKDIERGIMQADLNLTPSNDGYTDTHRVVAAVVGHTHTHTHTLTDIERGMEAADLNLAPSNDGSRHV